MSCWQRDITKGHMIRGMSDEALSDAGEERPITTSSDLRALTVEKKTGGR